MAAALARNPDFIGRSIREIRIEGLQRTREDLVVHQLASREGGIYSVENCRLDRLYLDRLGIFSSIEESVEESGGGVVLVVRLKETLPVAPYVSVTVTQENGISVGPAAGAVNVFGRALNVNLAVEFGGATNVYFRLRSPLLTRFPWFYEINYGKALRDNTLFGFTEHSQQAEAAAGYQLRPNLALIGRFRFLDLISDQPGITLNPAGRDRIPSVLAELRWDTRDSWSDPRNGWYLDMELIRNGLGSDYGRWWTGQFDVRRYQKFTERHAGAVFSLLSLQSGKVGIDLPEYMTYGIGGTNSVRGWNLGARKGKDQWLNTAEYRYTLVKPHAMRFLRHYVYWGIQLAVYGDLGTAWTGSGEFSKSFIGSGGYGVRLILPFVGLVRFDRAYGNALRPCYGLSERADAWGDRVR